MRIQLNIGAFSIALLLIALLLPFATAYGKECIGQEYEQIWPPAAGSSIPDFDLEVDYLTSHTALVRITNLAIDSAAVLSTQWCGYGLTFPNPSQNIYSDDLEEVEVELLDEEATISVKLGDGLGHATVVSLNLSSNHSTTTYSIIGRVAKKNSVDGLIGVTMVGLPNRPITNGNGFYSDTVPEGWSGTITPQRSGYSFTPASASLSNVSSNQQNINFTGTTSCNSIAGQITASGLPLEGVRMDGLPYVVWTDDDGRYFSCVPNGWSGTADPHKAGFDFSPSTRTYSNVAGVLESEDYTATAETDTIAGHVTFNGAALPGVTLNGLPGNPVTDASGYYTAEVPFHWSGTVTPQKSGYAFTLASRTYVENAKTRLEENFTAILGAFEISGRVTFNGSGLADVLMVGLPGSILTDVNGDYVGGVPYGWSGTVTPQKLGYQIPSRVYSTLSANQTGQNYEAIELPPSSSVLWFVSTAQELSNALLASQSGEIIVVKPGTYVLTQSLSLHNGVTLLSEAGADQTLLQLTGQIRINQPNVVVAGFTIESSAANAAIELNGAANSQLKNCVIKPAADAYAVEVINSSNVLVQENLFSTSRGVSVPPGSSTGTLTVRNNHFKQLASGIEAGYNASLQVIVENNRFEQIYGLGAAIDLDGPLSGVSLSNNVFLNTDRAIAISDNHPLVDHNTFVNNQTGLRIYSSGSATLTNNLFQDSNRAIDNSGTATVSYQMNWQNTSNWYNSGQFIRDEATIWEQDPQFVDVANGDLHLQGASPARGVGESGSDLGAYGGALGNAWVTVSGDPPPPPEMIELVLRCPDHLLPGDTVKCTATAYYAAGYYLDAKPVAQWSSSDHAVLAPQTQGRFQAGVAGQATVTVAYDGFQDQQAITIEEGTGQCHPPMSGEITRVSVDSSGTQANNSSEFLALSADGQFVAFSSWATNLVAGDTNGQADIFVYDRDTGQTTRVSVSSAGTQANEISTFPAISADGRYVAFEIGSFNSNLIPGDTNDSSDILIHDRSTGQTTRVSVASNGTQGNGYSSQPTISADGRYVAFLSSATNLVAGDTNVKRDVFVHDRNTGQTTRASVSSNGVQANGDSAWATISADGRYVAFSSPANNLVADDTNGNKDDVFVHDRNTGQTTRVSVSSNGLQSDGTSSYPVISADGRYVAFLSNANNLVPDDLNTVWDVFVHDRSTGNTQRVSVASDGTQSNRDNSGWFPAISADGRYVAFQSDATNLVPCGTGRQILIHDRETGETRRVSETTDGTAGNSTSDRPTISAGGSYVAFLSNASNLVLDDNNNRADIFVRKIGDEYTLFMMITAEGIGSGTVESTQGAGTQAAALRCGTGDGICKAAFTAGDIVTLVANPAPDTLFNGWGGDDDCLDGQITMDTDKTCTATFIGGVPDLTLTNTASKSTARPGEQFTYTLEVVNNGAATAHNVQLVESYDGDVTFVSATPTPDFGDNNWALGDLGSNETRSITVTVQVNTNATGNLENLASIFSNETDRETESTDISALANVAVELVADLALSKVADASTVTVGNNLIYTLTLTNQGPSDALGILVTDDLPAEVSLVSASSTQGDCNTGNSVVCEVGTLPNGNSVTVTIEVTAIHAGEIANTAELSTAVLDENLTDNTGSVSVMVTEAVGEDLDGDGVNADTDCDDTDPTVYPGATELCDRKDNDCNPTTPERDCSPCVLP